MIDRIWKCNAKKRIAHVEDDWPDIRTGDWVRITADELEGAPTPLVVDTRVFISRDGLCVRIPRDWHLTQNAVYHLTMEVRQ